MFELGKRPTVCDSVIRLFLYLLFRATKGKGIVKIQQPFTIKRATIVTFPSILF